MSGSIESVRRVIVRRADALLERIKVRRKAFDFNLRWRRTGDDGDVG